MALIGDSHKSRAKNEPSPGLPKHDEALWRRLRGGDERAFEELFRENYYFLYDYGLKFCQRPELVKDNIQELFAYIWQKRARISLANSIKAYLLVSFRRLILQSLQKQKMQQTAQTEFEAQRQQIFSAEDLIIFAEIETSHRESFKRAFALIPDRMREALYLKVYQNLNYKEIAAVMQLNPQVARNYVYEALKKLRTLLPPE